METGPGTWLIFGIVLLPVYGVLLAWFLDKPRDFKKAFLGVGYLVGLTALLWGGMTAVTLLIGAIFF
ncbi:MAG: hypothetical protein HYX91_04460 [Chloroflexi bacterium]|nr:hypothetical protein [Chloroflexota bacterium]